MHRSNLPPWKTKLLLGYVFAILGGSFLLVSIATFTNEASFLQRSQPATGVVIANIESRSQTTSDVKSGGTNAVTITYCPQFRYITPDGTEHTATSHACASPPTYKIEQRVHIRYLISNPDNAQIDSFTQKWTLPIAFGATATLFLPLGVFLLWLTKDRGLSLNPSALFISETTSTSPPNSRGMFK